MSLYKFLTLAVLLSSALVVRAGDVTPQDITGIGNIFVLKSNDWSIATPAQKVGCLDDEGRFIDDNVNICGVYTRLDTYPYTLSSKDGNCTFDDLKAEANTDSYYGKSDHAWTCNIAYKGVVTDELYTVNGFNYPFLCFGDTSCYYDAKAVPQQDDRLSLWKFRHGSQQHDITPGHVQLQLLWNKIGDSPKPATGMKISSRRV